MSELFLVNPRRRRRRKSSRRRKGRMPPALAAYWAGKRGTKRRRRRKLAAPRRARSRRRRHALMTAPRRRRRRVNPRRFHRRSRRRIQIMRRRRHRNPRFGMPNVRGIVKSTLMPAAIGASGALALDVAMGYASPYLPSVLQSRWALLGVKLAGAIGIGMVVGKFLGRDRGRVATLGATTVVVYGAAKSALQSALPTVPGLSGYSDFVDYSVGRSGVGAYLPNPNMGFYSPAPVIGNSASSGVGAYMPPGMSGLEGYNWQADGM